jgi:hypothetical protein
LIAARQENVKEKIVVNLENVKMRNVASKVFLEFEFKLTNLKLNIQL